MIKQHNNSVIFKYVEDDLTNIIDFSYMIDTRDKIITLTEINNGFLLGDAIYYDYTTHHYRRALAVNQIMSEVIGVVSKIIDKDTFELTLEGSIILSRYNAIPEGTPLYLSENISGKLVQDEPDFIIKIIGKTTSNGLQVDIQRGYYAEDTDTAITEDLRYYTSQEIQDIITKIKNDIY